MSIVAWNNWVEVDIFSDLTFNLSLINIVGVASVQFLDEKHWVVDSFEGTVHNVNNGEEHVALLNYRDNNNDPLFQRIREHITSNFWPLIQEAIREQTDRANASIRSRSDRAHRDGGGSNTSSA